MSHKVERHTWGLREALFSELEALRSGKIDARRAMASAKLAQAIMKTVEVELVVAEQWNRRGEKDFAPISTEFRLGKP